MEVKENSLLVKKTARYYTLGEYSEQTEEIVLVFHGYAQLAKYFIKKFESIVTNKRMVIAPEGLSRFYWQGMDGRVVASWMTREDRGSEIKDQVAYLDQLYQRLQSEYPLVKTIKIVAFSQGVSTAMRWVHHSSIAEVEDCILWAGAFPMDLLGEQLTAKLKNKNITYVFGDNDPFIKESQIDEALNVLKKYHIEVNKVSFSGEHIIDNETLMFFLK